MRAIMFALLLGLGFPALSAELTTPVTIPTAEDGDQVVQFNAATKKPMPVSDDKVEILGTNIAFVPMPADATKIHWGWTFSAHFKGKAAPISIVIEDETTAPLKIVYETTTPTLRDGGWGGIAATKPLSKQFIAFIESGQPMFRVYRFTIKYQDGTSSKLHQASVHDAATLQSMIVAVAQTLR
jgi:hypothetical protein